MPDFSGNPTNLNASAFNTTIVMDVSASMYNPPNNYGDYDAIAVVNIPLSDMYYLFQFETDASNVANLLDNSNSNINYYVKLPVIDGSGKSFYNLNLAYANVLGETAAYGSTSARTKPQYTRSGPGRITAVGSQMIQHDFIKYLANELFNTPAGVEIFYNVGDLMDDISGQCTCDPSSNNYNNTYGGAIYDNSSNLTANDVFKNIIITLANVADQSNNLANELRSVLGPDRNNRYYKNNSDISNSNICLQLFNQLVQDDPARFSDIKKFPNYSEDGTYYDDKTYVTASVPFLANDTISFTLTITPAPGQGKLTGVNLPSGTITPRVYRIVLRLV